MSQGIDVVKQHPFDFEYIEGIAQQASESLWPSVFLWYDHFVFDMLRHMSVLIIGRLAALKDDFAVAFTYEDRVVITEGDLIFVSAARFMQLEKQICGRSVDVILQYLHPALVSLNGQLVFHLGLSSKPDPFLMVYNLTDTGDINLVGRKLLIELQQRLP
ncbi:hypothetical protein FXO38_00829 [Capsicum annuum]|uniref:Uncharacterized protein n=1 Tax=Capsicum annuum TaxID=4072 RepID=A0A2G2ZZA6_CAPAN|nr:hypothetical protein FXO37_13156 [Capsicum annuum]KAF3683284.1 hypothetical protein FXO38_00829 [Capsicum annuum]PHT87307.1 hypothetical protein T459_09413 [Capsicum annuum]